MTAVLSLSSSLRKRGWPAFVMALLLIGSAPAAAAWHEAKTKHFIVYADETPAELGAFAQRLERFDQAVRLVRKMTDPPLTDSNRLTIFVVYNQSAIERLAGDYGVVGFYTSRASGSIAFVPKKAGSKYDKWDLGAEAVFFHEYGHHLQLQYADAAIPIWVSEGFAEFFAPTQLRDDGSVAIGAAPAYRLQALFALDDLTLEEMLGAGPKFTGTEFLETYGRGWLLTHFLTFNPARHGQLDRYIAEIQKGTEPLVAARTAFGDLKQLNRELYHYLRLKKLPQIVLKPMQLAAGAVAIRTLTPGESAIMDVHMQSKRGVSKKAAVKVEAQARKIAAAYPSDPAVQSALAEAEFDLENYAAAEAAADRALVANPKLMSALVYKGRARMELARRSQARANWGEIRSWFLRANKVDPESAEPLLQFFNAYLFAGERPTKNAIDGLLYALAIAPNDSKLRLVAVRQLLVDGRIADAKRYFAPLAFEPHASKIWHDASTKIMAALNSNNRSVAIASLDDAEKALKGDD